MTQNRVAAFMTRQVQHRAALVLAPAAWFLVLLPWARMLDRAESFDVMFDADRPVDSWRPANTDVPLWVWWSSEVS